MLRNDYFQNEPTAHYRKTQNEVAKDLLLP